jgi:hypothetical protein
MVEPAADAEDVDGAAIPCGEVTAKVPVPETGNAAEAAVAIAFRAVASGARVTAAEAGVAVAAAEAGVAVGGAVVVVEAGVAVGGAVAAAERGAAIDSAVTATEGGARIIPCGDKAATVVV